MKKIYLLLIILIILCTGCSAEYTLTINEDLSVNEKVVALEPKSFFENYPKSTTTRVIDLIMSTNKEYLNENNYNVEKQISDESGVIITKAFDSLESYYSTSQMYTQLLSNFNYKKEGNIVVLNASGTIYREENLIEKYIIDNAVINIKVPFKVLNNNADKYDALTDTYIWNINEDTDYKEIYLEFDSSKKVINITNYIPYIAIGVISIVVIGFIIFILKRKEENNKI